MAAVILKNNSAEGSISLFTHGGGRITVLPESEFRLDIDPIRYSASYGFLKAYYDKYSEILEITYEGMDSEPGAAGITESAADAKYARKDETYTKTEVNELLANQNP